MALLRMPTEPPSSGGVILRPFRAADIEMICELSTDPYVSLISTLPTNATERQAVEFIERQADRMVTGVGYSFCIADRSLDAALGTAGVWVADREVGRATLGYAVAPSARGRGIATDALRAATTFAWTVFALCRLELYIEPWNLGSIRAAEAAGYQQEGLLRSHQPIGSRRADMLIYAILKPGGHPTSPALGRSGDRARRRPRAQPPIGPFGR